MTKTNSIPDKKQLYDVYLSYSHQDKDFAETINRELSKNGIRAFFDSEHINTGNIANIILSAIQSTRFFVCIISERSSKSDWCMNELNFAFECATDRSKTIIPIFLPGINTESLLYSFFLSEYQGIYASDPSENEAVRIAKLLAEIVTTEDIERDNFDLLSKYIDSGATNKATELTCTLINKLFTKYSLSNNNDHTVSKAMLSDLFPLLETLENLYDYDYGTEGRELANRKKEVVDGIHTLLEKIKNSNDLFYISSIIRLYYYSREIRWACIDATTHGDLSDRIIHVPSLSESEYEEKQRPFVIKYDHKLLLQNSESFTDDEWQFILSTPRYIYKTGTTENRTKEKAEKSNDSDLLNQVATFMHEGNKVFDLISENQQAEEFIRCLILSYERLQKYCEVVGEQKVCGECIDRIHELKQKLNGTFSNKQPNIKAQDGIKTLLGLTIPKTGKFDVFISHKSEDTDIATDMYSYLKKNMKEAFYDKETLPEMSEAQYRKSIMRALDGSSHFVLIMSDLSYLKSYWVSLEMEIFQSEIDEGRKPNANFLMVVTNKVFDEITKSNKATLPIEYRRCEIMRVEEYKTKLLSYLNKR